jgi:transmembrane sensor
VTDTDDLTSSGDSRIDLALYDRYVRGTASDEDRAAVQCWATTPQRVRLLDARDGERAASDTSERTDGAWMALSARIQDAASRSSILGSPIRAATSSRIVSRLTRLTRLGVGAGVAGLLAVCVMRVWPAARHAEQHYTTRAGERATVQLANGSTMSLAPATSAIVRGRDVTIDGEASFAVDHDPSHPFVVRTTRVLVTVLGTTFRVRQYANDRESRIIVDEGKVALHRAGHQSQDAAAALLTAKMVAHLDDSTVSVIRNAELEEYSDWNRGMLVFDHVPLRDVLAELARAYGTPVRTIDSALASERMTIQVSMRTQSLARVLDLIGTAVNAHHTYDGRAYMLMPGRAAMKHTERPAFPRQEKEYGR